MMTTVLRLLSLLGLNPASDPRTSRFSGEGVEVSLDSWTPGPKPLCHRHPTGPHPSGLAWTPTTGEPTRSDFAPRHSSNRFADRFVWFGFERHRPTSLQTSSCVRRKNNRARVGRQ